MSPSPRLRSALPRRASSRAARALAAGLAFGAAAPGCASGPEVSPATNEPSAGGDVRAAQAAIERAALCGTAEVQGAPPEIEGQHTASDGALVVMVRCALFAYQGRYRFARVERDGTVTPLALQAPTLEALEGLVDTTESPLGDLVGVPELDAATGGVTVLCKSRGPGDCGVYATFALGAQALTLTRAQALTCAASDAAAAAGEEARLGPDWPVVYP